MTSPPSLFHALLRPSMLQILRATGYHSTRPVVLDSLTDLAVRYLSLLCKGVADHAAHNHGDSADFDLTDVRLALQDAGALLPAKIPTEEEWLGEEDIRGVEEFARWFASQRMKELMEFGVGDGETDATDYFNALKKKHSKTGDDAKYHGTIIGKANETGDVQVEGGREMSIDEWILKQCVVHGASDDDENGDAMDEDDQPPPPSPDSSLSSVDSVPLAREREEAAKARQSVEGTVKQEKMDLT